MKSIYFDVVYRDSTYSFLTLHDMYLSIQMLCVNNGVACIEKDELWSVLTKIGVWRSVVLGVVVYHGVREVV